MIAYRVGKKHEGYRVRQVLTIRSDGALDRSASRASSARVAAVAFVSDGLDGSDGRAAGRTAAVAASRRRRGCRICFSGLCSWAWGLVFILHPFLPAMCSGLIFAAVAATTAGRHSMHGDDHAIAEALAVLHPVDASKYPAAQYVQQPQVLHRSDGAWSHGITHLPPPASD